MLPVDSGLPVDTGVLVDTCVLVATGVLVDTEVLVATKSGRNPGALMQDLSSSRWHRLDFRRNAMKGHRYRA